MLQFALFFICPKFVPIKLLIWLFQAGQHIPLLVYLDFQFEQSPTNQDASIPKLTHDALYIATPSPVSHFCHDWFSAMDGTELFQLVWQLLLQIWFWCSKTHRHENAKTFTRPFFEIPILFWFKILTSQFNVFPTWKTMVFLIISSSLFRYFVLVWWFSVLLLFLFFACVV